MKNIIITLCLLVSGNVLSQKVLLKDKLVADNFIVYDPPIKIKGSTFIGEPFKPLWYKAYCANNNPLEFETPEEAISYFENKPTIEEYIKYKTNFPNRKQRQKDLTEYVCGGYRLRFLDKNVELLMLITKKENDTINASKPFLYNIERGSTKFGIFKIVNNNFVVIDYFGFKALLESIDFKGDYSFDFEGEFQKVLLEQSFKIADKKNRDAGLNDTLKRKKTSSKSAAQPIPSWLEIKMKNGVPDLQSGSPKAKVEEMK